MSATLPLAFGGVHYPTQWWDTQAVATMQAAATVLATSAPTADLR